MLLVTTLPDSSKILLFLIERKDGEAKRIIILTTAAASKMTTNQLETVVRFRYLYPQKIPRRRGKDAAKYQSPKMKLMSSILS